MSIIKNIDYENSNWSTQGSLPAIYSMDWPTACRRTGDWNRSNPEESLEDLTSTLQNLIDGNFADENDLILANALLPELYDEDFQILVEPGINIARSLLFHLNFDNYIFPEQR